MTDIEKVVNSLNFAFQCDPEAVSSLIQHHVPCNTKLADHPHVVVKRLVLQDSISALGLINGVLNSLGLSRIYAEYDTVDGKEVLTGFGILDDLCSCQKCQDVVDIG